MAAFVSGDSNGAEYEVTFVHKDGHFFPALVALSAIRDDAGDIAMLVGTVKDITRHVAAEERLRVIADLTARLSSAMDLADVGEAALAELLPQFECGRGGVFVLDRERQSLSLVAEAGLEPGRDGWSGPLDLPAPAVDVVHSRESLLLVGQDALSPALSSPRKLHARCSTQTTLNMPLLQGDSVVGVLFLAFDRQRSLGPDEMDLLRTIAPILAQALDRARLFEFQRSIASTLQRAMLTQQAIAPAETSRWRPGMFRRSRTCRSAATGTTSCSSTATASPSPSVTSSVEGSMPALMGQLRSTLTRSHARPIPQSRPSFGSTASRTASRVRATTLLYGVVDSMARRLCYTSAGHPPVLLVEPDKDATFLQGARGWPLESPTRNAHDRRPSAAMPPGSTIVLYTDGLIERRNERLEDGLARLAAPPLLAPPFPWSSSVTSCSTKSSGRTCRRCRPRRAPPRRADFALVHVPGAGGAPLASDPRCAWLASQASASAS